MVVRPTVMYALQTVALRKRQEAELQVAVEDAQIFFGSDQDGEGSNEYIRGKALVEQFSSCL